MINFFRQYITSLTTTLGCLFAILILQGCGAERTTPFDPDIPSIICSSSSSVSSSSSSSTIDNLGFESSVSSSSSSSSSSSCSSSSSSRSNSSSSASNSSSSFSSIAQTLIWSGSQTDKVIDTKEKNTQAIRNSNDFYTIANSYVNFNLDDQNFEEGQVVLVDDGEIDSCAAHLESTANINLAEVTDNTVKVTVNYVEKPKLDKCSSTFSRPFYFYYIKTKKIVVFEQKII